MEVEIKEFGVRIRLIVEPFHADDQDKKENETQAVAADLEISQEPTRNPDGTAKNPEPSVPNPDPPVSHPVLERAMRNWRREEAVRRGVPTYIIMTERTIQAIVRDPPSKLEHLRQLKGIGPKTMELYGESLIELVKDAMEREQLEQEEE